MKHQTRQRAAIIHCLRFASGPLNPKEILGLARQEVSGLGLATVYRNLKLLNHEGLVHELSMPGEGARYELAGLSHHHHFYCRGCARLFCVEGCPDKLQDLPPTSFVLEEHEIMLYGLCANCSQE